MYLDRPGGVSLDDCEAFHRRAQALVENLEYDFLEVSSPGLDRPLKTDADFQAALGEEIVVRLYRAQHGVKEYTGFLAAAQAEEIALNTAAGEIHFPRKAVALAKRLVRLEALGLE
jgi:ribosome maturation factor RimP